MINVKQLIHKLVWYFAGVNVYRIIIANVVRSVFARNGKHRVNIRINVFNICIHLKYFLVIYSKLTYVSGLKTRKIFKIQKRIRIDENQT